MGGERKLAMLPSGANHVMGQGIPPIVTLVLRVKEPLAPVGSAKPPMRVKVVAPCKLSCRDEDVEETAAHIDGDDAGREADFGDEAAWNRAIFCASLREALLGAMILLDTAAELHAERN